MTRKQKIDAAKTDVLITAHQLDAAERAVEAAEGELREKQHWLKLVQMNAKIARSTFSKLLEEDS